MTHLIMLVLAFILMLASAVAGISYLGDAYGRAGARASATRLIGAADQILGAEGVHRAENGGDPVVDRDGAPATATLVAEGMLSSVPPPPAEALPGASWSVGSTDGAPFVTLELDPSRPGTLAACDVLEAQGDAPYGCVGDLATMGGYRIGGTSAPRIFFEFHKPVPGPEAAMER